MTALIFNDYFQFGNLTCFSDGKYHYSDVGSHGFLAIRVIARLCLNSFEKLFKKRK